MKERLLKLVKCLAAPEKEIIGDWEILPGVVINSIEIVGTNVYFNIWNDDVEYRISSDAFEDDVIIKLIIELEQILLN